MNRVADSLRWPGSVLCALWAAFCLLSWQFHPDGNVQERPILPALGLLGLMFLLYLVAARVLLRQEQKRRCLQEKQLWLMWRIAVAARVIALFSLPVQEVDFFRYLWDGRQLVEGVSPYAFSPAQVDEALATADEPQPAALRRLTALINRSAATREIFAQVDHRAVPSIYPPAAQAVFALVAMATPENASWLAHLTVLRLVLMAMDLLTIRLLTGLLRRVGMNPALALVYAWSPLVLKEFANSAHMDVIAVTLLMGGMCLASAAVLPGSERGRSAFWRSAGGAACWDAAILAKFFPLVLAPLWWRWWRRSHANGTGLLLAGIAVVVIAGGYALMPRPSPAPGNGSPHSAFSGLAAFAGRWEMNDLAFAVIHENLRPRLAEAQPANGPVGSDGPWFAVTPNRWRTSITGYFQKAAHRAGLDVETERVPFLLTQIIVAALVAGIACQLAWRPWSVDVALATREFVRRAFGTLAALWYLSATQNPWYWTWALPFVPFARSRAWLLTGGLVLLYYLRFWLRYHGHLLPPGWDALRLFDEGVVWLEHLPVLLMVWWTSRGWNRPFRPQPANVVKAGAGRNGS